ncbi:TPA: YSIRK-type signal peptide-containing protein, partial [Streptococcus suis]|nr:YSIRK-type signal peptide-containing protein [Streptococcus suis]
RRYSIRRLSIGVVSALTAIFIFGTSTITSAQEIHNINLESEAKADSIEKTTETPVQSVENSDVGSEDNSDSLNQVTLVTDHEVNTNDSNSGVESDSLDINTTEIQNDLRNEPNLSVATNPTSSYEVEVQGVENETMADSFVQDGSSTLSNQADTSNFEINEELKKEESSPSTDTSALTEPEGMEEKLEGIGNSESIELSNFRSATLSEPVALNNNPIPLGDSSITIADGRIAGEIKLLNNSNARGNIKSGYGSQYGIGSYYYFNNHLVQLIDSNGVVVKEVYTNNGEYNFTDLPYGTYTVNVPVDPRYMRILDNVFQHKDYRFEVTLTSSNSQNTNNNVLTLVGRPAKVTMETSIGTYNGTNTLVEYDGGVSQFTSPNNNQTYTYIGGPIYTDILGEYLSLLQLPTLSQEEVDNGYVHIGWYVNGVTDADGQPRLLTQEQVLNLRVPANDLVITPAWDRTSYKVSFLTNSNFGSIEQEGNREVGRFISQSEVVLETPTVIAKPGYEFIGWINDLTEELVTDIENYQVYEPTKFFARYRPLESHTVTFLSDDTKGTLDGSDNLSLNASDFTSVPTPVEKSGYRFVGWIRDLSGKIYTPEQVANLTPADQTTIWYANYEQVQEPSNPPLSIEISHAIQVLPEGHPLRDMIVKVPTGTTINPGILPDGLTFDSATNTFSGQLPPGQYTIPVTATLNEESAEAEILIDIFSVPTISVTEGDGETIVTVTQGGQSVNTVIPHGNTITVENKPDGSFDVVITDAKSNEISRENIRNGKDGV